MKMRLVAAATVSLVMSTTIAATATTSLNSDMDKLSYSIGADLGKNFKRQGIDISSAAMAKGLQDGISGGQLMLTEQQMKDVLSEMLSSLKKLKKIKLKVKYS
jgi:FKBP-type peptidyl-prolyl cis-trans isomerase FklB